MFASSAESQYVETSQCHIILLQITCATLTGAHPNLLRSPSQIRNALSAVPHQVRLCTCSHAEREHAEAAVCAFKSLLLQSTQNLVHFYARFTKTEDQASFITLSLQPPSS